MQSPAVHRGAGGHDLAGALPADLAVNKKSLPFKPFINPTHLAGSGCRYPLFTVAPEGTTKPAHCLLAFSTGAFVAGAPVLPVLFKYRFRHMPLPRLDMHWALTPRLHSNMVILSLNAAPACLLIFFTGAMRLLLCMQSRCHSTWHMMQAHDARA